jgi:hypothetical protein
MTPNEKAKELLLKFMAIQFGDFPTTDAKQCALIAVDEIIKQEAERCLAYKETDKFIDYWQEVKQEIEKI